MKQIPIGDMTREQWLEVRRKGIGGSDAAAVLGLSPYDTPLSVYMDKLGLSEKELKNPEAVEWGNRLEAPIAKYFADNHPGCEVRETNCIYVDEEYPYMLANLDREVIMPDGTVQGLEIKTTSIRNKEKWEDGDAPLGYLMQVHHYLSVRRDIDVFNLCCLIGGQNYVELQIHRDEAICTMLREREGEFWKLVETQTPPPFDGSEQGFQILRQLYPQAEAGTEIDLNNPLYGVGSIDGIAHITPYEHATQIMNLENDIKAVKTQLDALMKERDMHRQVLINLMGSAEKATVGEYVITYKNVSRAEHVVKATSFRQFRMKGVPQ